MRSRPTLQNWTFQIFDDNGVKGLVAPRGGENDVARPTLLDERPKGRRRVRTPTGVVMH
jgi:hypothetical protein